MLSNATGITASVGLDDDYDHVHQTNTVKAYELIHYLKAEGHQLDMKGWRRTGYFLDGHDVGRIDDLAVLAAEIGLDRAEVVCGIQGVPLCVTHGTYGVLRAPDASTSTQVLEHVRTGREAMQ